MANPFYSLKGHSPLYPLLINRELSYHHESNRTLQVEKTLWTITELANKSPTTDRTIKYSKKLFRISSKR